MAWDASGRWIPDDIQAQARQVSATGAGGGIIQNWLSGAGSSLAGFAQRRAAARSAANNPNAPAPQANPALPRQPLPAGGLLGAPSMTPRVPPAALPRPATPAAPTNPGAEPVLENSSVSDRLNGLLAQDSIYTQMAREGGVRTAGRRGLLNSSIAAGAGQAAAIAAAAPIASQEAGQVADRNNARLQSALQYRSASALQSQGDASAMTRQLSAQAHAGTLQANDIAAAMTRLGFEATTQKEIAQLNATTNLTQSQIAANSSLIGNYLQAFSSLAANPEIPASARNAYMSEFQRILSAGSRLTTSLGSANVNWGALLGAPGSGSTAGLPQSGGGNAIADAIRNQYGGR